MGNSSKNVLIVDDDETLRYIINRKLSKEGYRCDEAGDSDQAMSQLSRKSAELVVLDIDMPGKKGNELLPEIQERFPETAVIMASCVSDSRVIAQCIKDGAQDYIQKPFNPSEILLSAVRSLDKRKLEIQIRKYQDKRAKSLEVMAHDLRKYFLSNIQNLVTTLELADRYTAGHSMAVIGTSLTLAKELNLPEEKKEDLYWGALLHDVGKIAIDPRILNKPGELTTEEYRHIMTHAVVGPRLVKPFVNDHVTRIISHHHDHYDGSGLNQLIQGEDIPLCARIVAVADAYDAMTSDRPYRPAMSKEYVIEELKSCSGTQFDPLVARAMLRTLGSGF